MLQLPQALPVALQVCDPVAAPIWQTRWPPGEHAIDVDGGVAVGTAVGSGVGVGVAAGTGAGVAVAAGGDGGKGVGDGIAVAEGPIDDGEVEVVESTEVAGDCAIAELAKMSLGSVGLKPPPQPAIKIDTVPSSKKRTALTSVVRNSPHV